MNKRLKIYIGILFLVIGGLMYLEYSKPKPVDWTETYSSKDKIPFGSYVLYNELAKLFPNEKIESVIQTPAAFLDKKDSWSSDNLYFLLNKESTISDTDVDYLLNFVDEGNDVFIISNSIPNELAKELNLDVNSIFSSNNKKNISKLQLSNPDFKKEIYTFNKINQYSYFTKIDTTKSIILGEINNSGNKKINFIKTKYGKGYFYINLFPEAFSNYFLLKDSTYTYAVHSLNYINKKNIFWDEQNKSINAPEKGILMFIFSSPALLWAWRILIVGAIIYVLFFGKRVQRIIPILKPLENTTVEFTKTIGNIYYNQREHKDIINKKITYFLYFVKEHYFLDIHVINEEFSEKLHLKSGVSKEITDKITNIIQKNKNSESSSEEDLKIINQTIDLFYKQI